MLRKLSRNLTLICLLLILSIAAILRLYRLENAPAGLLIDEPAFGYNAYSILKTGKDEHGKFLPLIFQSYGDDKLPINVYAIVPSIATFGLNHFSIRLPAAIAGIAIVLVMYLLLKELKYSTKTTLIATSIIAISPWPFFLSRLTRESNFGLLFLSIGLLFLVKTINTKRVLYVFIAAIATALCWYSYVAYRFATLLFFAVTIPWLVIIKQLSLKHAIAFLITASIAIMPYLWTDSGVGTVRFRQLSLLEDKGPQMEILEKRNYCTQETPRVWCYLNFNKLTIYPRLLVTRYLRAFSPEFLFTEGIKDLPIFNVPNSGQFPTTTLPFLYIGIISLFLKFKNTLQSKFWGKSYIPITLTGLLIMPIPTIIAGDVQNMRLAPLIPFLIIVIAQGFERVTGWLQNNYKSNVLYVLSTLFMIFTAVQSMYFFTDFFTVHVNKFGVLYNAHLPGLMKKLGEMPKDTQIIIKPFFADPIMYYSFYNNVEPSMYQNEIIWHGREELGYLHAKKLRNIEVVDESPQSIYCKYRSSPQDLVYVTDEKLSETGSIYTAKSENNVHALAYIYDLKALSTSKNYLCE